MPEVILATEIAKFIQAYGTIGVIALFVAFLVWQEKRRYQREESDRMLLTNHLSEMIKESSASNKELAIGLTKLSSSVDNFQSKCGQIQDDLQKEVDRLKRG